MYSIYWQSMTAKDKQALAKAVGTTASYLRHIMHGRKKAGFNLAIQLHTATNGDLDKSILRPDIYPSDL